MKKNFLISIILFASTQLFSASHEGCNIQFKDSTICAEVNFTSPIGRKDDATFKLTFYEGKNKIILKTKPNVYLWMIMKNGHEHGSEKLTQKIEGSDYLFSNVWFMMLGQWQLHVKFKHKGKDLSGLLPICVKKSSKNSYHGLCK